MLKIIVLGDEFYDEVKEEFTSVDDYTLELEHSLVSLSKWESKFEKPFLATNDKTSEEAFQYIEDMILNEDCPENIVARLSVSNIEDINKYIDSKQSATTFGEMYPQRAGRSRPEVITSELIYYWMVAATIPFSCEHWNLNRLFALIQIYSIKNSKQKNMPKADIAARNQALNAQRKANLGTTG